MEHKSDSTHITILYFLIVLLAATLLFAMFTTPKQKQDGTWVCGTVACGKTVNVQDWVSTNCADTPLNNGSSTMACHVVIDGQQQLVPLSSLNLTALGQQCIAYVCTQDVMVRPANYSINVSAPPSS